MSDYLSVEGLTGLEFLQKIITEKRQPPMAKLMGFSLVEVGDGHAVFEALVKEDFYNPLGTVHGGFAATLLGSALGCAVQTKLPKDALYGTVELKINYIRPMLKDTGLVRATGKVLHVGRRMATSEARLEDVKGKLLAHGSTTCMIY